MAKFLIGLVTGVLLVFLTVILLIVAALRLREKPPEIASDSVLVLRLSGDIPEKSPMECPIFWTRTARDGVDVWLNLRKAAGDSRIRAIVLQPEGCRRGGRSWRKSAPIWSSSGSPASRCSRICGSRATREYYLARPPTASTWARRSS